MNVTYQVAKHLKVAVESIKRCEEWSRVWFVVVEGKGGRFVSKSVVRLDRVRTASPLSQIGAYIFNMNEYGRLKTVGVTDQFTSCCCCGKENLKRTVVMKDSHSNYSFFGTTCAHNASRSYYQSNNRNRKIFNDIYDEVIKPNLKTA